MNAIDDLFAKLKRERRSAFIPFLAAGDPDLAFTADAMRVLADAGADVIELGVPFSDPVADGPVIQASYTRALQNGFKLDDLFQSMAQKPATPAVAMGSYTLIHKRGPKRFIVDAQAAGFSGMVVPDLPVEEADELAAMARDVDFKLILLVTPTTSPTRAERIVAACTGFVYVVSVVGITGAQAALAAELPAMIERLRGMTATPLCVGFGVSTPEQAKTVAALADGVIVGSALVKAMAGAVDSRTEALKRLKALAASLSQAVRMKESP
jgi:tryptophan synthase alpha chain